MRRVVLISVVVLVAACRQTAPEPVPPHLSTPATSPGAPTPAAPSGHPSALGWSDPPGWRRVTPSSTMRRAQYAVPRTPGAVASADDGELAVFYFGQGQGGSVEDNLARWYSQFQQSDGRSTRDVASRETRTVNGLAVTVTYAQGRFIGGGMPGGPAAPAQDNWALLGAIADTPGGPWFFKLTGPAATVASARPAFDDLVRSMHIE